MEDTFEFGTIIENAELGIQLRRISTSKSLPWLFVFNNGVIGDYFQPLIGVDKVCEDC
jgi:hypothetical protein